MFWNEEAVVYELLAFWILLFHEELWDVEDDFRTKLVDLEEIYWEDLFIGSGESFQAQIPQPSTPPNLMNVVLNRAETGGIGLGFNRSVGLACLLQNFASPSKSLKK